MCELPWNCGDRAEVTFSMNMYIWKMLGNMDMVIEYVHEYANIR